MNEEVKLPFIKGASIGGEKFTPIGRRIDNKIELPPRNPGEHAQLIRTKVKNLKSVVEASKGKNVSVSDRRVISVQMSPSAGVDPERLASKVKSASISLLDYDPATGMALIDARPDLNPLLKKLDQYEKSIGEVETDKSKKIKNQLLIDYIDDLKLASFSEVLGDSLRANWNELSKEDAIWIEFHCRGGYLNNSEGDKSKTELVNACATHKIDFRQNKLRVQMAEEEVFFIFLSITDAFRLFELVSCVFEVELPPRVALQWLQAEHRSERSAPKLNISQPAPTAPEIVVLDTGIAGEHPLLKPLITGIHTALDNETGADSHGHGTEMAGVALYGDTLPDVLQQGKFISSAWLRTVQLIKAPHEGAADSSMRAAWPVTTERAINHAQSGAAKINQIFALAVTAEPEFPDRASSWTNVLDKAAYNSGDGRLMLVSTGNHRSEFGAVFVSEFPQCLTLQKLDEPAHSFNVVTIGAWTRLVDIPPNEYEGFTPLARRGYPSPYTRMGHPNSTFSGIKPDVVFEGGNRGKDAGGDSKFGGGIPTLCCTSTSRTVTNPFAIRSFWGTSCATALASQFTARIWNEDPTLRPETIRALLIHSADWTEEMKSAFSRDDLLSICGYGVPDIQIATACIKRRATMIFEEEIQGARVGKDEKLEREIRFFEIPVPEELATSNDTVNLRVTLSYFAEPNGYRRRVSRGVDLAWKMQGPQESVEEFKIRINGENRKQLKNAGKTRTETKEFDWEVGPQKRGRGTVQSDRWKGPASFLAGKKLLAVYPINGWWEGRKEYKTKNQRFSVVVSVETAGFDIYTPIQIAVNPLTTEVTEIEF